MVLSLYTRKYSEIRSWWLSKLPFDNLLYNKVLSYVEPAKKEKILEIGCDRGRFVNLIRPLSGKVVGIDINKKAIEAAACPDLYQMDATSIEFPDNSFDKIFSMHTIEHIPDLNKAFREMERVLKSGSKAILCYPFELVRGMSCLVSALFVHRSILGSRKMHLHKIDKKKVAKLIAGTKLVILEHSLCFVPWPVFITVLKKL